MIRDDTAVALFISGQCRHRELILVRGVIIICNR